MSGFGFFDWVTGKKAEAPEKPEQPPAPTKKPEEDRSSRFVWNDGDFEILDEPPKNEEPKEKPEPEKESGEPEAKKAAKAVGDEEKCNESCQMHCKQGDGECSHSCPMHCPAVGNEQMGIELHGTEKEYTAVTTKPYSNLPEDLWDKMDSCVEQVMAKGNDKPSAIAICYTSLTGDGATKSFDRLVSRKSERAQRRLATSLARELGGVPAAFMRDNSNPLAVEGTKATITVRSLLEGKIHEAFTTTCDQLFQRGYMDRDQRIALSGLIGKLLTDFGDAAADQLDLLVVSHVDAHEIAMKSDDEVTLKKV